MLGRSTEEKELILSAAYLLSKESTNAPELMHDFTLDKNYDYHAKTIAALIPESSEKIMSIVANISDPDNNSCDKFALSLAQMKTEVRRAKHNIKLKVNQFTKEPFLQDTLSKFNITSDDIDTYIDDRLIPIASDSISPYLEIMLMRGKMMQCIQENAATPIFGLVPIDDQGHFAAINPFLFSHQYPEERSLALSEQITTAKNKIKKRSPNLFSF